MLSKVVCLISWILPVQYFWTDTTGFAKQCKMTLAIPVPHKDRWMYDRYQKVKFCTDIYKDVSVGLDILFYYPCAYILYSCCLDPTVLTSKHTSYFNHLFIPVLPSMHLYIKIIAVYTAIHNMKLFMSSQSQHHKSKNMFTEY